VAVRTEQTQQTVAEIFKIQTLNLYKQCTKYNQLSIKIAFVKKWQATDNNDTLEWGES
jgi:hypothetical protein